MEKLEESKKQPSAVPAAEKGKTVLQPAWHEIYKIECPRKDDLDQHKLGMKHKKNMEKLEKSQKEASAPAAPAAKYHLIGLKESPATANKGKTVVQPAWCEICKIKCTSKVDLDQHKMGQKHKNMEMLEESKKQPNALAAMVAPAADKGKTVVQSAWCEICKIDCNNEDVLNQHKLVKKPRNEEKLEESEKEASASAATVAPAAKDPVIGPKESPAVDKGKIVMQSAWCEICKIECTREVDLDQHKLGKKHKKNMEKLEGSQKEVRSPAAPAAKDPVIGPKESPAADKGRNVVQSAYHEICKIDCNKDVLDQHKLGKKHENNQEKLEESEKEASAPAVKVASAANDPVIGPKEIPTADNGKTAGVQQGKKNQEKLEESEKEASAPAVNAAPAAYDPVIGPKESPVANNGKTVGVEQVKMKGASSFGPGENLETRRRKLIEAGVAADEIKVCTICNVVCNSQKVFTNHLAGTKHVGKVKNREQQSEQ